MCLIIALADDGPSCCCSGFSLPFSPFVLDVLEEEEDGDDDDTDDDDFVVVFMSTVCFRVTIICSGVVNALASAPAIMPISNSSCTGNPFFPPLFNLFCLKKVYARKKRNASAMLLTTSYSTPL